ncbi:MAG: hypothetical protein O9294_17830 [Cytophagales bacterium]|nr:hypothetical protein [Cytophagales bacterium]
MKSYKLISILPALCASIIDIAITVFHQPKAYWQGNLQFANEGNPIGKLFMQNHIMGLFIISALWLVIIALLGYYLPKFYAKVFLLFCVIAHSFGASTWLSYQYSFWLAMLLIAFNSYIYIVCNKDFKHNVSKGN